MQYFIGFIVFLLLSGCDFIYIDAHDADIDVQTEVVIDAEMCTPRASE